MNILVTGATGLLGNNIVRALLESGQHRVRVLARNGSDRSLVGLACEVIPGDVRDRDAVAAACRGCTAVIHSAAVVQLGWTKLAEHRQINVVGTENVLAAARDVGARVVHISTVDTLGVGSQTQPLDEDSPREGKVASTYVVTKSEAELVVEAAIAQGLHAVIVHPGFMLGPWDWKPSSGRMLLAVARSKAPFAPIGGGSVCDVRDVAQGTIAALEHGPTGRHYILAGHNLPYFDLWKHMAQITGGRPPLMRAGPLMRIIGSKFGDWRTRLTGHEGDVNSAAVAMSSQWHYYSSQRAQQELGYQIRPLADTLRDAWAWLKDHHP